MGFTGEFEHSIDAKQRLAIPSEVRGRLEAEQHGEALYVSPGTDGALWLWPERTFWELSKALEQSPLPDDEMVDYRRLLFSQSTRVELDKTGRIRIPDRMLRRFNLSGSVTILGVDDHLEVRDAAEWTQQRDRDFEQFVEISRRARSAWKEQRRGGGKESP